MDEVVYVVITAGSFDVLVEVVCEDDEHLLHVLNDADPHDRRRPHHRILRLSQTVQADLHTGVPDDAVATRPDPHHAADHLWMHFTRMSSLRRPSGPDDRTRRGVPTSGTPTASKYLDALSGLFVVQVGHGREELAEATAAQARKLAFFPIWSYAHPTAIELADRLAAAAPGDLNKVFFSTGGGESVETAWKLAKQYFKLIGKPTKTQGDQPGRSPTTAPPRAPCRSPACPAFKHAFEPLVPGTFRVPNTNFYRAPRVRRRRREGVRAVGGRPDRGGHPDARDRTSWPPSSSSRCRTPAAASRRRPATSSDCARSATPTTCCSSPTR